MSEETIKNLFIKFSHLEGTAEEQLRGKSLGLSIGKTILEKMGGSV